MRYILVILMALICQLAHAQFWFGPRIGANRTSFIYQSSTYLEDSFKVAPSYNYEIGAVMIYQASDMFSVHSELFYEGVKKELENRPEYNVEVSSSTKNHFLSIPIMFRAAFGREPVHFFVNGGTKIRYWLAGDGHIVTEGSDLFSGDYTYDRIDFGEETGDPENNVFAVPDANRLQFALIAGAGAYLDLAIGGRLLVDFRYTFGHSNMGFDNNPDFFFTDYTERFSYRNNTMTLSVCYLFEYDVKLQSKGMSTIKDSNRRKKK